MKLKKNKYYLIKCSFLNSLINKNNNSKVVVKYLGKISDFADSFECSIETYMTHDGETPDGNKGREGYCIYLAKPTYKVVKELTKEEAMIERL